MPNQTYIKRDGDGNTTAFVVKKFGRSVKLGSKSAKEPNLHYFAAIVKMGYVGGGYSMPKLIANDAESEQAFRNFLESLPRAKSDQAGFIISLKEITKTEYKFIVRTNNYDPYLIYDLDPASKTVASSRILDGKRDKVEEELTREFAASGIVNGIYKTAEDYYYTQTIQRTYAPEIKVSGDDKNKKIRLINRDRKLDDKLLYEYFKSAILDIIPNERMPYSDKIEFLCDYVKLLPKYRKYVLADERPLVIYVDNETRFDKSTGTYKDAFDIVVELKSQKQYRFAVPESSRAMLSKNIAEDKIAYILSAKNKRRNYIDISEEDKALKLVREFLREGKLELSSLPSGLKGLVHNTCSVFGEVVVDKKNSVMKKHESYRAFEGSVLGKDFYEKKPDLEEYSEEEYQEVLAAWREKNKKKFDRLSEDEMGRK